MIVCDAAVEVEVVAIALTLFDSGAGEGEALGCWMISWKKMILTATANRNKAGPRARNDSTGKSAERPLPQQLVWLLLLPFTFIVVVVLCGTVYHTKNEK